MDSHCHLNFFAGEDRADLIRRARANGVEVLVTVSVCPGDFGALAALAEGEKGMVFFTIGVHPTELDGDRVSAIGALLEDFLTTGGGSPVAIGETGLDYFSLPAEAGKREKIQKLQGEAFGHHLAVARERDLPLVIHCRDGEGKRDAWMAMNRLLDHWNFDRSRALIHCFSYGPEELDFWQRRGGFVSFAGNLTRPSARALVDALCRADRGQLLFETDSPFLLPEPLRSTQPAMRNEPANVRWVWGFAAKVLERPEEEIRELSLANGRRFFGMGRP